MSKLYEETPINEEEVPVAIVANEKDRDKISNDLMFLIIDLILDDFLI